MAYSIPRSQQNRNGNSNTVRSSKRDSLDYENIYEPVVRMSDYDTPKSYNDTRYLPKLTAPHYNENNIYDEVRITKQPAAKSRALSAYVHESLQSQLLKPSSTLLATKTGAINGSSGSLNKLNGHSLNTSMNGLNTKSDQKASHRNFNGSKTLYIGSNLSGSRTGLKKLQSPSPQINRRNEVTINNPNSSVGSSNGKMAGFRKLIPSIPNMPSRPHMPNIKKLFSKKK